MAYQSKYTGLQIDDILDSVEYKQDQIEDLASIRAGAQKGATALQSYTEKYTGTVTGIKINGTVKSGSGVIDLGTITTDISGKVDKVAGKQLSTEDFTTALKNKLEGLNNYDDTELSEAIETLRGDFDNIVSGDTTTAIKTFNEVIAFLDGLTDTQDLESIIASIEQQIAGKMDKVTLATVATSGSYNDLSNKPTIPSAVTESTVSGWGFTKNTGTYSKPSTGIPKTDLASAVQTSLGKADTALQSYTEQYKGTITGVSANGTSVSTSGVANIPAASTSKYGVTKLSSATNSASTSLAATASAVKTAYDLANGKQDKLVSGTNIKTINGTSILGSGDITISASGTNLTENDDITVRDINARDITAGSLYGIVHADEIWDYMGINVLNITDEGILIHHGSINDTVLQTITSGDGTKFLSDDGTYKTISSGGSSSGSGAYSEVNHETSDTTFTLTPNTFHVWDEVSALTLTLGSETTGVANEYLFQFTSGATATSLTLPGDIKWANDSAPTIEPNMIYQVSILKGLASVLEFSNAPTLIENKVTVSISGTKYLVSLQYAAASDIVVKVRTADSPISVNILYGEISKTASPAGPMVDSSAYIESITPAVDTTYNYTW